MINVVKIGGNVIDNKDALERFVNDFASLPQPRILVHGGGKEATAMSASLGIETKMVDGRRITDEATLQVVTMVYAGLVNKRIVAMLQAAGVNAIGLCGADGRLITSRRRNPEPIDYGYVGDVVEVNVATIKALLEAGFTPVVCAITRGIDPAEGLLLNTNADSVACAVAEGAAQIGPTTMHYCFEKAGVLLDVDNPDSLIQEITPQVFERLKADGIVHSGMLPKITNAIKACERGVESVIIQSADALTSGVGTVVRI